MSPAMAAHLTERFWDVGDIVKRIEEWEAQHETHPFSRILRIDALRASPGTDAGHD